MAAPSMEQQITVERDFIENYVKLAPTTSFNKDTTISSVKERRK